MVSPITSLYQIYWLDHSLMLLVFYKNTKLQLLGYPNRQKLIDVGVVNVFGSFGLKLYPPLVNSGLDVTTSAVAGKFTPKEMLLVAFGSPDVIGN